MVWFVFTAVALVIVAPALNCWFHSDDIGYIERNPYVHELSLENITAILDPWGDPARNTANYAPVHLLAHALEWWLWGSRVFAYHVVNVLLHALVATLLVLLLGLRGLPFAPSFLAGGLFLLHPANVETVAWIFQLKSTLALALVVAALWAHPRHPLVGLLFFALALLTKASALLALPVAAVFTWVSAPRDSGWRRRSGWLLGWAAVLLLYSVPGFHAFQRTGQLDQALHSGILLDARTIVAIGARYLVMAVSGIGISPFHEPDPARSWLNPWWLGGLVLAALLVWRVSSALIQRREEAAWWIWAAAGYLPISQVFRFAYPMADRYLYFILPGLIGAAFFAGLELWPRVERRVPGWRARLPDGVTPGRVGAACAALLAILYGLASHQQARVWRSPTAIAIAAAANYPDGLMAHLLRARQAGLRGDAAACAGELRVAAERGYGQFWELQGDPAFAMVGGAPEVQAVIREMAANWIELTLARPAPSYFDLYWRGQAHAVRGELEEAETALKEALRLGGELDSQIQGDLMRLRRLSDSLRTPESPTAGEAVPR
jgi:hypothetical protein